jgi:LysM domain
MLMIGLFLLVVVSGVAWMQAPTPDLDTNTTQTVTVTPMVLGAIKTATPTPLPPKPEDRRPEVCSAPYQEGWLPIVVKAGDTLTSLMGTTNLSVTQAAALNCIDDPSVLPVGSVIWLPVFGHMNAEPCQQLVTILDCAVQSQGILGAQQLFQNGMMIWREDTREIWVILNNDDSLQVFEDTYVDGEADPTASAPNTFFVPKRGFGKVWAQLGGEKSALGWGTAPEAQIGLTVQPAGRVSYTTYVRLPDGGIYAATVLPHKSEGWWVKLGD